MYYNTNKTTGVKLKKYKEITNKQEGLILELFRLNPKLELSPFEVHTVLQRLNVLKAPITSIRRAITDLTNEDKLVKTTKRKLGPFGRDSFCWKYNKIKQK